MSRDGGVKYRRWRIKPADRNRREATLGRLPPLLGHLLLTRGIAEAADADAFLAADDRLRHDHRLLAGMADAVERLVAALASGETIAVYGDFDADGITATALLMDGLAGRGAPLVSYIPHRVEEGYGLNPWAIDRLRSQGVSLIVTVDCGIGNAPEVAYARRLGIGVIVTDHHAVLTDIPDCIVVNPRRPDCAYPFKGLSGVGVAYKLLQALSERLGASPSDLDRVLDLVAIGTVADLSPLVGENRYLVRRGLSLLNESFPQGREGRLGLRELCAAAGLRAGAIDAEAIAYSIAPRLNAAGRLDHALPGYRLLVTADPNEAREQAAFLEAANQERQRLTREATLRAREAALATDWERTPLLVVEGSGYGVGIIGLVAGALQEELFRPVVVIDRGDEVSRGSGRSPAAFDLVAALAECADLLLRFGGHSRAAGFTIATANIEALRQRLLGLATERLAIESLQSVLDIDAEVSLGVWKPPLAGYAQVQALEPFGTANPEPVFVSRGVRVMDAQSFGDANQHLRLKLADGGAIWSAVGFGLRLATDELPGRLDIAYSLGRDGFAGYETLRLLLKDVAPA